MRRRWLPDGLSGQLLAWLLGGLLVSHLVGLLLLSRDAGDLHPMARTKSTELFLRMFSAVAPLEAVQAARVLEAAGDGQTQFVLTDRPLQAVARPEAAEEDSANDEAAVIRLLRTQLGLPAEAVAVCAGPGCAPPTPANQAGRPRLPLVMQALRPDGQWVRATLWAEVRTRWWWPVSFWLQLSLVPVFVGVALGVRRFVRPGRTLVAAAERASRGERVEPLAMEGPREIREIIRAFNQMQLRISRFVEDRTRMLGAISHDFRTPITSLRLRAEMLPDAATRGAMIRTLDEMRGMVDETLQFTRDEASTEPTQDTDLAELVDCVLSEQSTLGGDVAWIGRPAAGVWACRCRPLALRRAIANLVENAVHHGGRARVRLRRREAEAVLAVEVEDDGPGIAAADVEAAFAPFSRLRSATAPGGAGAAGGAGLGLAIARSCARAHGGDVVLLPREDGAGLLARLTLPQP